MVNAVSTLCNWLPGVLALALCAPANAGEGCDRASFGDWMQVDHMNTRHRVLERTAVGEVKLSGGRGQDRKVVQGTWTSAYTGVTYTDINPRNVLDVDHLIPVCWAWDHGAAEWSRDKRRAFYNDVRFLVPVERGVNREKGAMGVMDFVPGGDFTCAYVDLVAEGIAKYGLTLSEADRVLLSETRGRCAVQAASGAGAVG